MNKKIENNSGAWYHWGRWNQVMLFTAPWSEFSRTDVFNRIGLNDLSGDIKILHGNYYFLNSDLERINRKVVRAITRDAEWFADFFAICDAKTDKLLSLEGKGDIIAFIEALIQVMGCSVLVEISDMCIDKYLKQICDEENKRYPELAALVRPPKPTLLMQYQKELSNIDDASIDSFIEKYRWVGTHAFEGKALSKKDAVNNNQGPENPSARTELPTRFAHIIRIASELSFYRSNLMETMNKVAFSYRKKLTLVGKQHGLEYEDVIALTHSELRSLVEHGSVPSGLKARKKEFGTVFIDGRLSILVGQPLELELEKHTEIVDRNTGEIVGTPASKGIVQGAAKVLTEAEHVSKIEPGDILVTHETTPDYIVAMNKAAAFVTDVGGLTCHAAITAREMRKPCIIGTKNATKILEDNDVVEVNANKGLVRILKKYNR